MASPSAVRNFKKEARTLTGSKFCLYRHSMRATSFPHLLQMERVIGVCRDTDLLAETLVFCVSIRKIIECFWQLSFLRLDVDDESLLLLLIRRHDSLGRLLDTWSRV